MFVKVMIVRSKEKHPNADVLYVYKMFDGRSEHTIVANSENIYEVGDNVVVATSGARLKKELIHIQRTNVRGVWSEGMALGKTDKELGADINSEYCLEKYHVEWPSIESLYNVVKRADNKVIEYASKIKLDGTCAGVQVLSSGELIIQSRNSIITSKNDNLGFAAWVEKNVDYFKNIRPNTHFVIFGEWCGQGIQNRCSISNIGRKVFCVFAIQYGQDLDVNPESIRNLLPDHEDVFVLPFENKIVLDFSNKEDLNEKAEIINQWIAEAEKCDPFVKKNFGVEGLGEGFVLYPLHRFNVHDDRILVNIDDYKDYVFKAKGDEHKVVKTKKSVQVDPEVAKNVDEFVELFVTENRLNQIAEKVTFSVKETGNFIKLFSQDVLKESNAELEASGLTWKDVSNSVSDRARKWFLGNVNKI
jgi:tRNA-binding EMAP/Myf-like protein